MTIKERAEQYVKKSNLNRYFGCGITPQEDYIKGAIDQDPISRADEKEKCIKKALDAHCSVCIAKGDYSCKGKDIKCSAYKKFKQAMEE